MKSKSPRSKRSFVRAIAALGAAIALAQPAAASDYPNKPVRIVVHSSPGGQLDVTTRQVAQQMSEILGQPFVVENRPGADGLVGIRYVKTVPADGYTLLAAASTIAIQPAVKLTPGYELEKDFTGIGPMVRLPFLVMTSADKPFRTFGDYLAAARSAPGKVSFASSGNGSTSHLGVALLMQQAGIDLLHVPYKGNAAAMPDLLAGRVDMLLEAYGSGGSHVRSGRVRALAVTSAKRLAVLPDVPTIAEQGVPGFSYDLWLGLLAPAGTPPDVVKRLSDALRTVLTRRRMTERFAADGAEGMLMTPQEFNELLRRDLALMGKLIATLGLSKE